MLLVKWSLVFIRYVLDTFIFIYEFISPAKIKRLPPITDDILLKSACEISQLIRDRKVSATQVITAYIHRIKECEVYVNALVDERFNDAMDDARAIDETLDSGEQIDGALLGVPFTGKDSQAVKGLACTAGLYAMRKKKATDDSNVVRNLKEAGAICLGITNIPELCYWWDSSNKVYGTTSNPYDLSRIPGGSSGGNACLISYGGSLFGTASDIAGSIRIPSGFCGIYGHKTTHGIVNTGGQYPPITEYMSQFLTYGPLCRYAEDIRPVLTVMAGGEDAINDKLPRFAETVDWSQVKILYQLDSGDPFCTRTKKYIRRAIIRAARHFEEKYNSSVEEVSLSEFEESFDFFMGNFRDPTATGPLTSALLDYKGEISIVKEFLLSIIGRSKVTFCNLILCVLEKILTPKPSPESVLRVKEFKNKFHTLLGDNSIFLYPVHPEVAPKHRTTIPRVNNAVGYCGIFNLLSTPVTTCPLGVNRRGLPLSVQIISTPYNDHLTIEAAIELTSVFGGWPCPSAIDINGTTRTPESWRRRWFRCPIF